MKECKVVRVHDGRPRDCGSGRRLIHEDFPGAEEILNGYLKDGYEIKSMVPLLTPAEPGEGGYAFYRGGFVFYLEREVVPMEEVLVPLDESDEFFEEWLNEPEPEEDEW